MCVGPVETPGLSGTVYSVAEEVESRGVKALPFGVDVRDHERVQDMIDTAAKEIGPVTICINNASALVRLSLSLSLFHLHTIKFYKTNSGGNLLSKLLSSDTI